MLDSRQIFQNVCKSHVVNQSRFAIERIMIDLQSPRFMQKLELIDLNDIDVPLLQINDYVVSGWIYKLVKTQHKESAGNQKFTKEWTDYHFEEAKWLFYLQCYA